MANGTALIEDHGEWLPVKVAYDYHLKEALKSLPGSLWRPERKGWLIPAHCRAELERVLIAYRLVPSGDDRPRPQRSLGDQLAEVYQSVPQHLRRPLSRAVVTVLHPDRGGSDELAREAIEAMKRVAS